MKIILIFLRKCVEFLHKMDQNQGKDLVKLFTIYPAKNVTIFFHLFFIVVEKNQIDKKNTINNEKIEFKLVFYRNTPS